METTVLHLFKNYILAILLGALMGLERERKEQRLAGLRTFILVTLFGSICGQIASAGIGPWILPAGLIAVTLLAAIVQFLRLKQDIALGLTTSVALLVAYGIGVMVSLELTGVAVALCLATTAILYYKPQMHAFTHQLSEKDIHAIFQFGLVAFIILPILPDRSFGPYDALNPYNIWLMVVLISALNLVGYVTLNLVGQRWGGPVLGLLGGLASSTATTLSTSRHARDNPEFSLTGAVVVSLASAVVLFRVAFLVGIIHVELLRDLALPLCVMFFGSLFPLYIVWKKTASRQAPVPETRNPAELKQALLFGFIYALVLLAVSAGKDFMGNKGVYFVALFSGLTDVDAITLTNARLVTTGTLGKQQAAISILIAYVANLTFKLGLIAIIGTGQMFRWTLLCFFCLALPTLLILF